VRTLALLIEYDGTRYAGWQRQGSIPTIQGAIEAAAGSILAEPCRVIGSGRTDAGVHALGQVAHLSTRSALPAERIRKGLNALLPDDIVIRDVLEAAPAFHARYDARLRIYRYALLARPRPSALLRRYTHHVVAPLDLEAMRAGAAALAGRHDFTAFRVVGTATASTVCTVHAVRVERRGDLVTVTVAADRFLRQMVRLIVGSLVAVGRGARPPEAIAAILASGDNQRAGPALPPCGLYLRRVVYGPEHGPALSGPGSSASGAGSPVSGAGPVL
jgi:tRNA pseudouridine38-40 synthase